jgi:hypothetical protein
MSPFLLVIVIIVVAVAALFIRGNRATARTHAKFRSKDVEAALAEVLSQDSADHDGFDLFLAWPIEDPFLESVRQRCFRIIRETDPARPGQDLSDEGQRQIAELLDELRNRPD